MTDRADRIREALQTAFSPEILEIADESSAHAGHAGARPEGETHFAVTIMAKRFAGMTRIARHQAVNDTLADEFKAGLHALRIKAIAPPET